MDNIYEKWERRKAGVNERDAEGTSRYVGGELGKDGVTKVKGGQDFKRENMINSVKGSREVKKEEDKEKTLRMGH